LKKFLFVILALAALVTLVLAGCAQQATPAPSTTKPASSPAPTTSAAPTAQVIKWNMYTPYVPSGPAVHEWWWKTKYIDEISKMTGGRLQITAYYQGEHPYGMADMLKCAKELKPEILHIPFAQSSATDPRLAIADLPMLYPSGTSLELCYDITTKNIVPAYIQPILEKDYGYTPFFLNFFSGQRLIAKDYFLTDANSLKGHKIRVWNPQLGDLITMLGGVPQNLGWGDVYTSLQTGLIDGLIGAVGGSYSGGIYETCKAVTTSELQFGLHPFCVKKSALDALPPDIRDMFLKWSKANELDLLTNIEAISDHLGIRGVVEQGVTIKPMPKAFNEELRGKAWDGVWKPWIQRAGGPNSPAADAFNTVAKQLIKSGLTVPNYTPY
jgi:TRAP-type transport system periplasmic protein